MQKDTYKPDTLALFVTDKCTFECGHCGGGCSPDGEQKMEAETATKYIEQFSDPELGIKSVATFGGEPFLDYELLKNIAETSMKNEMMFSVDTNGFWANKNAKKYLSELNAIGEKYDQVVTIFHSIDEYHPLKTEHSAKMLAEYVAGKFEKLNMAIASFVTPASIAKIEDVIHRVRQQGINLSIDNFPMLFLENNPVLITLKDRLVNTGRATNLKLAKKIEALELFREHAGESIVITPDEKAALEMEQIPEDLGFIDAREKDPQQMIKELERNIKEIIPNISFIHNEYQ